MRRPVEDAGSGPSGRARFQARAPARVGLVDSGFQLADAALQEHFGEVGHDLPGHVANRLVADQLELATRDPIDVGIRERRPGERAV